MLCDHPDCAATHRVEAWFAAFLVVVTERFKESYLAHIANVEKVLLQAAVGMLENL